MLSEELDWANNLRAIATVSVVVLHVSAPILGRYGELAAYQWWVGNFFDSLVRFCVPLFFMLSGALILPKEYSTEDFFKKRFLRIAMPFVFWSLVYILYDIIVMSSRGIAIESEVFFRLLIVSLKDGASYHLWYVYVIIGIYMFFPVIHKWIINSTKKDILFFLIIWLVVVTFNLPFFDRFQTNIDLRYFSGYIGYPVLGYYLRYYVDAKDNKKNVVCVLVSLCVTSLGTYVFTYHKDDFDSVLYSYLSPNVMLASIGVFLYFKNFTIKSHWVKLMVKFIGKYSYGIYLSHVLVLGVFSSFGVNWSLVNPILGIPITSIICLMSSTFIVLVISRIPYLRSVSG